jgi:death-on-curing protein
VTVYLSVEQVLQLNSLLLRFGGASGLRDRPGLEAAIARPAMTFGGEDLYVDLAAKAAALMHSLALNHPFVDGNKRIAAASAEFFVEQNGMQLLASDNELVQITLAVAAGHIEIEALTIWFRQRLRARE